MFAFFQCVAEAVVENGAKGLLGMVPGGAFAVAVAGGALAKYRQRQRDDALREEVKAIAAAGTADTKQAAAEVVRTAAAGESPETRAVLEGYLVQIPAAVRQSLKRPEDPSGKTVPASFALTTPEQVLQLLPPRPPRFREGDAVVGRSEWQLRRVLGVGGFGEVWLARHQDLGAEAAVKFCHGPHATDLLHEGRVIMQVQRAAANDSVVPLRDAMLGGETPWLMFDYVPGGLDLGDWVRQLHKSVAPDERPRHSVRQLHRIAAAVGAFHRLTPSVVHRDLKPSNILYDTAQKRLRVTDFGIGAVTAKATLADEAGGGATSAGRLLSSLRGSHTPLYASPQQRGGADPDPRDDVHALGVIAYQMLTGPAHLAQGPGPDFAHDLADAGAPRPLIDLIGRCVASRVDRRPATAADLAAELAAMSSGAVTVTVPPVPLMPPVVKKEEDEPQEDDTPLTKDSLTTIAIDGPAAVTPAAPPPEPRDIDVVVSGNWRMNRVVRPFAKWRLVTRLPAKVTVRPSERYRLDIMKSARDANIQGLAALAGVEQLEELDLTGCKRLSDAGFALAATLTHLRSLRLNDSAAGDAALKPFGKLPRLESLELDGCRVTDAGLAYLKPLRGSLTSLSLRGFELSDAGATYLAPLRRLTILELEHTSLTDAGLAAVAGLSRLEFLGLDGTRVTDAGLCHVLKLSRLEDLDLSGTAVTDLGLAQVATLKKLEGLYLGGCAGVTDRGLALLAGLKKLNFLWVTHSPATDAGIAALRAAPRLTELRLDGCAGVTDASVDHLTAMTRLEVVNLTGTRVTAGGAARLCAARPECTVWHESFGETPDPSTNEQAPDESGA